MISFKYFHINEATEDQLRSLYDLYRITEKENNKSRSFYTFDEFLHLTKDVSKFRCYSYWVGINNNGEIIGFSQLKYKKVKENSDSARFEVRVLPKYRRLHIGTNLIKLLIENAYQENRKLFTCTSFENNISSCFLVFLGGEKKSIVQESVLNIQDLEQRNISKWFKIGKELKDYKIEHWDGFCPSDKIYSFANVKNLMNTMPRDNRRHEVWKVTPEWIEEEERIRHLSGCSWWTFIVLLKKNNKFVGFLDIIFSKYRKNIMQIEDIAVDPEHRGKGIAKWLNADMIKLLIKKETMIKEITTINAKSNVPILKINRKLGFQTQSFYGKWEFDYATMIKKLKI